MAKTLPAEDLVAVGQVLQGKYRVESILGQGGMGVVAACTHLALNDRVAIKMLRPDVLSDRDAIERFTREVQASVRLKSEHIARVLDVGVFDGGTPYMVMEFLEGQDLGIWLEQRKHLPKEWAVDIAIQTAEALAEAHAVGIIHRDIKPTNLFVTTQADGTSLVKVLDFGISKSFAGHDMNLTQTQSVLGTPAYMSPEQMRSARGVDTRSDIWSLGTVLYELLEGERPFPADSFSELCVKVAVDDPAPMLHAPAALARVVMRCLEKDPDQRYQSMAELGQDLVPFASDPQQATQWVLRMHRVMFRARNMWGGGTDSMIRWDAGSDPFARPLDVDATGTPVPQPRIGSQPHVAFAATAWQGGSQPFAPVLPSSSTDVKSRAHSAADEEKTVLSPVIDPNTGATFGDAKRPAMATPRTSTPLPAFLPRAIDLATNMRGRRRLKVLPVIVLVASVLGIAGTLIAIKLTGSDSESRAAPNVAAPRQPSVPAPSPATP
ncbi:MAG: serine/threonine protein kinase [Kofleriaceae bacterium]